AAISASTPEETVATCPDHIVGAKAKAVAKRKASTKSQEPSNATKKVRLVKKSSEAGSSKPSNEEGDEIGEILSIVQVSIGAYNTRLRPEVQDDTLRVLKSGSKVPIRGASPSEVHEERLHQRFTRSVSIGGSRGASPSEAHEDVSIGGSREAPPSEVHEERLHRSFMRSISIGGSRGALLSEVHEEHLHRRFARSVSIGGSRGALPSEVDEERLHRSFTRSVSIEGSRGASPSKVHEERLHRRFTRSVSIEGSRGASPSKVHEERLHRRFTRSVSIGGSRGAPPSEVHEERLHRRLCEQFLKPLRCKAATLSPHQTTSVVLLSRVSEIIAELAFLFTCWFCRSDTGLGPDMSFDTPASPEYMSSLARASLAEIPHNLYPRLPSEGFVMLELSDYVIGVYHRIFDFSGVRASFSSFLRSLIKHYMVHFSQLGPLGLNKVVTFEVLYRSLQIKLIVTWFRVFQTLCKLGGSGLILVKSGWKSLTCDPVLRGAYENVMGIHDFFCLPEWTGAEVQEKPHHDIRPTLQRLPFYCTPPTAVDAAIPDPTLKDLDVGNPSAKVIAKAEASQKRKASTSGATSSHITKRTIDDEDDAYVEIQFITPIRSTADHTSRNQGRGSATPAAEGIMTDVVVASSGGASHPWFSSGVDPSFRDISGDAIHRDFFPFSPGPYYATYLEGGVAGNLEQFPILGEMVRIKALTSDQLTAKIRVKETLGKVCCFSRFRDLGFDFRKQIADLNDKLSSFDGAFMKAKAKVKDRKKKIKSLTKNLDQLNTEVARLSAALNQAIVLQAEKDEEILWLKASLPEVQGELLSLVASAGFEHRLVSPLLEKLARATNVPTSRDTHVSPPMAKESTVTHGSSSLEFPSNNVPSSFATVLERNEEWVNEMVDRPNNEMTDDAGNGNPRNVFVQGVSHVIDDGSELTLVELECVFSSPNDVVVALSSREKDDGLLPSSAAAKEATAAP
ncbi:hypothetical protein Tco_0738805, partial [Tanacetum coccineum]